MKILHVAPLYYPSTGGAERHVKEVSERLASRGHEVTVLTTNVKCDSDLVAGVGSELANLEFLNGVRVVRLRGIPGRLAMVLDACLEVRGGYRTFSTLLTPSGLEMLSSPPRNLGFVYSIARSRADVVASWGWLWSTAYFAYIARRVKRFRLVGFPLFHTAEHWVHRQVYESMLAVCDALIVNTAHERDFILGRVPGAKSIVVAGVGVDQQVFARSNGNAFRKKYALGDGPIAGYVGRMLPNKGADKVLAAMSTVWASNADVRLVLAGKRDYDFPQLETLLCNLTPAQRDRVLIFPNFSESEKGDLYDALDVFVLPSISESFGIAYLEAWICRKPVVGSRIGSTSCVIEDGQDGFLVDPTSPTDIGRAILELLTDAGRRSRMGERGHTKALEHFSWESVADRVERAYLDVVADCEGKVTGRLSRYHRQP